MLQVWLDGVNSGLEVSHATPWFTVTERLPMPVVDFDAPVDLDLACPTRTIDYDLVCHGECIAFYKRRP